MIEFSIIIASRDLALSPFFSAIKDWPADKDSELIIIDSSFKPQTAERLRDVDKVKQIIYAPPIREPFVNAPRFSFRRDFNRALNSALVIADGKYIIRIDDYILLKENFFEVAREDIKKYSERLIIGQKAHENEGEEPWIDYFSKRGFHPNKRYVDIQDSSFTWSFGIASLDILLKINGWDERYDLGYAGEDSDILARYMVYTKKPAIFDKQLMGYGLKHDRQAEDIQPARWIFEATFLEIKCGKTWAYNPVNLLDVREQIKDEMRKRFTVYEE